MFHAEFSKAIYLPIFFSFIKMTDETPGYQKKRQVKNCHHPVSIFSSLSKVF